MKSIHLWLIPVRIILSAMWLLHGLEKFGVRWPAPLAGGTHSVSGMLGLMVDTTPIGPVKWLAETLFLPLANLLQYPVGLLEIALGVAFATGVALRWAALCGTGLQLFFWLGFLGLDWPWQYPLVIAGHLLVALAGMGAAAPQADRWATLLRLTLGAMWLVESGVAHPWNLLLGALLLAGVATRISFIAALALVAPAYMEQSWGSWVWSYYWVVAAHVTLILAGGGQWLSLSQYLPERVRKLAA